MLIECKECGKSYSSQAGACPGCACPTIYNYSNVICKECGNLYNANEHVCPKCTCPIEFIEPISKGTETKQSNVLGREKLTSAEEKSDMISLIVGVILWGFTAYSLAGNQSLSTTESSIKFIAIALIGLGYFIMFAKLIDRYIISKLYRVDYAARKIWISCIMALLVLAAEILLFVVITTLWAGGDWEKIQYVGQIGMNVGFMMFVGICYIYRIIQHNRMSLFLGRLMGRR